MNMCNAKSAAIVVTALSLWLCACAFDKSVAAGEGDASFSSGCEFVKLDAVFHDPLAYNGRAICTYGYIASEDRFVAFYPLRGVSADSMLDMALIPENETPAKWQELLRYPQGTRFKLRGKLDIDKNCIINSGDRQGAYICTPVKKPLFLDSYEGAAVP